MDGNGRWAEKRGMLRPEGHRAGMATVKEIVFLCSELGIKVLTLYAFSTENWSRPKLEINILMSLLKEYLKKEISELHHKQVKIHVIGRREQLPKLVRRQIEKAEALTVHNKGLVLNIALNYSGRIEIIDAIIKLTTDFVEKKFSIDEINNDLFEKYLYTTGFPDPDLLIRTSGEFRISNFLLWQIAYTELWVTDTYWPDFRREELLEALIDYQQRDRRFGRVKLT